MNRTAIESLVKAGAFDSLGGRRAQQLAAIDRALQSGASAAADRRSGQMGLFGDEEETPQSAMLALPEVPEWEPRERLAKEKEVLGFYLSSHPLAEHEATLAAYCTHTAVEAATLKHRTEVMLGGMISSIKYSHTKNPKPGNPSRYAMFDLEDTAGMMRCIVWPEQFAQYSELIEADAIRVLRGAIDKRPGSEEANLIVNEVLTLEALPARYTRGVRVRIADDGQGPLKLERLHEIMRGYPGNCPLELQLQFADGSPGVVCTCNDFRVAINEEMTTRVKELVGADNFRLMAAVPSGNGGRNGKRGGA